MANCWRTAGRTSVLIPLSMTIALPLAVGITGANATRLTPLMRLTMNIEPAPIAPELPAERNASPSPSLSRRKPVAREVFAIALVRIAEGESLFVKTSGAW